MTDVLRKKKDTNAAFNKFIDSFAKDMAANTVVAKLAKVKKFDPKNMYVEAMPLPSEENSVVINVPVATLRSKDFVAYYPLQPDDYVVLLFMDGDTDQILLGQDKADTERAHDVSDCIAVGGFTLYKGNLDIVDDSGFVIQNLTNKDSYIDMKKNGDIEIKAKNIKLESEQKIEMQAGQKIDMKAPAIHLTSGDIKLTGYASYNGREIARRGDPTTDGASIA